MHMCEDIRQKGLGLGLEPFQVKLLSWETIDAERRHKILIRHVADKLRTLGSHLRCFSDVEAQK